jgi:uroporphyrinogen decarboxylase
MTPIETPRTPDFENLLAVLRRETPSRPTLFEFIGSPRVMLGEEEEAAGTVGRVIQQFRCFLENGYEYVPLPSRLFGFMEFSKGERHMEASVSQNEGGVIKNAEDFESYPWPDPADGSYDRIDEWARLLPDGARFLPMCPGGVLENLTDLVGFEDLCFMIADEPELVARITEAIGTRLHAFYERLLEIDSVGAVMVNDDWGFKTQTMLSPSHMREFIFPWHKKIVELIHQAGRPAILHSCGNLSAVWDDIIEDIGFDGKHSYEDGIQPVEEAYATYGGRIAILGGIDLDFLCHEPPEVIAKRSRDLLEMSRENGGYALGTGNSVPYYVPRESFLAIIQTALNP